MKTAFSVRRLILSGLFAALICVLTVLLPIPLGHGFANPGDVFVLLAGYMLGSIAGFFAAGIGSMLSDLFLGYAVYAPATFIIKGFMALVCTCLSRSVNRSKSSFLPVYMFLIALVSECIMVAGYFSYEWIVFGLPAAVADAAGNALQGAFSVAAYTLLSSVITKTGLIRQLSR